MSKTQTSVLINSSGNDLVSRTVLSDERHVLSVSTDRANGDVYLSFSSQQALYDFAKSLLHEAIYGQAGTMELYPLKHEGKLHVVNGARLTGDSSRVFLSFDK